MPSLRDEFAQVGLVFADSDHDKDIDEIYAAMAYRILTKNATEEDERDLPEHVKVKFGIVAAPEGEVSSAWDAPAQRGLIEAERAEEGEEEEDKQDDSGSDANTMGQCQDKEDEVEEALSSWDAPNQASGRFAMGEHTQDSSSNDNIDPALAKLTVDDLPFTLSGERELVVYMSRDPIHPFCLREEGLQHCKYIHMGESAGSGMQSYLIGTLRHILHGKVPVHLMPEKKPIPDEKRITRQELRLFHQCTSKPHYGNTPLLRVMDCDGMEEYDLDLVKSHEMDNVDTRKAKGKMYEVICAPYEPHNLKWLQSANKFTQTKLTHLSQPIKLKHPYVVHGEGTQRPTDSGASDQMVLANLFAKADRQKGAQSPEPDSDGTSGEEDGSSKRSLCGTSKTSHDDTETFECHLCPEGTLISFLVSFPHFQEHLKRIIGEDPDNAACPNCGLYLDDFPDPFCNDAVGHIMWCYDTTVSDSENKCLSCTINLRGLGEDAKGSHRTQCFDYSGLTDCPVCYLDVSQLRDVDRYDHLDHCRRNEYEYPDDDVPVTSTEISCCSTLDAAASSADELIAGDSIGSDIDIEEVLSNMGRLYDSLNFTSISDLDDYASSLHLIIYFDLPIPPRFKPSPVPTSAAKVVYTVNQKELDHLVEKMPDPPVSHQQPGTDTKPAPKNAMNLCQDRMEPKGATPTESLQEDRGHLEQRENLVALQVINDYKKQLKVYAEYGATKHLFRHFDQKVDPKAEAFVDSHIHQEVENLAALQHINDYKKQLKVFAEYGATKHLFHHFDKKVDPKAEAFIDFHIHQEVCDILQECDIYFCIFDSGPGIKMILPDSHVFKELEFDPPTDEDADVEDLQVPPNSSNHQKILSVLESSEDPLSTHHDFSVSGIDFTFQAAAPTVTQSPAKPSNRKDYRRRKRLRLAAEAKENERKIAEAIANSSPVKYFDETLGTNLIYPDDDDGVKKRNSLLFLPIIILTPSPGPNGMGENKTLFVTTHLWPRYKNKFGQPQVPWKGISEKNMLDELARKKERDQWQSMHPKEYARQREIQDHFKPYKETFRAMRKKKIKAKNSQKEELIEKQTAELKAQNLQELIPIRLKHASARKAEGLDPWGRLKNPRQRSTLAVAKTPVPDPSPPKQKITITTVLRLPSPKQSAKQSVTTITVLASNKIAAPSTPTAPKPKPVSTAVTPSTPARKKPPASPTKISPPSPPTTETTLTLSTATLFPPPFTDLHRLSLRFGCTSELDRPGSSQMSVTLPWRGFLRKLVFGAFPNYKST